MLYLSAQLRQGDSGSAVIGADGAVIGVVFAVSPDNANTAYALHVQEVREALRASPTQRLDRGLPVATPRDGSGVERTRKCRRGAPPRVRAGRFRC